MSNSQRQSGRQRPAKSSSQRTVNDHVLVTVTESVPGDEPTDYDIDLSGVGGQYRTRYWRCEACGQERNRPGQFQSTCPAESQPILADCGYSVEDPRTRRALTENMGVEFVGPGSTYEVRGESGREYIVDVEAGECTCPDYQKRGEELEQGCKHVRRVDIEIQSGEIPGPDGRFVKAPTCTR